MLLKRQMLEAYLSSVGGSVCVCVCVCVCVYDSCMCVCVYVCVCVCVCVWRRTSADAHLSSVARSVSMSRSPWSKFRRITTEGVRENHFLPAFPYAATSVGAETRAK
jgi:hypothetical protein